jgi:hypothetical protein
MLGRNFVEIMPGRALGHNPEGENPMLRLMGWRKLTWGGGLAALALLAAGAGLLAPEPAPAKLRACVPFHLKTEDGKIINPLTGENADQPYSSRQTCGACHDYDQITKGYHFQQGWDRIKDDFNKQKPWLLSDGMMGKF